MSSPATNQLKVKFLVVVVGGVFVVVVVVVVVGGGGGVGVVLFVQLRKL